MNFMKTVQKVKEIETEEVISGNDIRIVTLSEHLKYSNFKEYRGDLKRFFIKNSYARP